MQFYTYLFASEQFVLVKTGMRNTSLAELKDCLSVNGFNWFE